MLTIEYVVSEGEQRDLVAARRECCVVEEHLHAYCFIRITSLRDGTYFNASEFLSWTMKIINFSVQQNGVISWISPVSERYSFSHRFMKSTNSKLPTCVCVWLALRLAVLMNSSISGSHTIWATTRTAVILCRNGWRVPSNCNETEIRKENRFKFVRVT